MNGTVRLLPIPVAVTTRGSGVDAQGSIFDSTCVGVSPLR